MFKRLSRAFVVPPWAFGSLAKCECHKLCLLGSDYQIQIENSPFASCMRSESRINYFRIVGEISNAIFSKSHFQSPGQNISRKKSAENLLFEMKTTLDRSYKVSGTHFEKPFSFLNYSRPESPKKAKKICRKLDGPAKNIGFIFEKSVPLTLYIYLPSISVQIFVDIRRTDLSKFCPA